MQAGHATAEAEAKTGVVQLQAKEPPELTAATRSCKEAGKDPTQNLLTP